MPSRKFRYQLNTTNQLVFLKSGKVLNDLAWKVIADVNRLLMAAAGLGGQPETKVNDKTSKAYFCRFITDRSQGKIDEEYLHAAAELVRIENITTAQTRVDLLKKLTFKKNEDVRFKNPRGKGELTPLSYAPSLKIGLTLLLAGLWKRGAVLLPANIYMPWHPWLDEFPKLMSPFVSEITLMFRRLRGDDTFESKIKKSKVNKATILNLVSRHTQFIHASTLYSVDKNLTEDSLSNLWIDYAREIMSGNKILPRGLAREDFPALLAENFSVSFELKSYHEMLISKLESMRIITASSARKSRTEAGITEKSKARRNWQRKYKEKVFVNRKMSKIYQSMWPSESVFESSDDYFFTLKEMRDVSQFHPENLKEFWELSGAADYVNQAANCWAELQLGFLKKRRLLKSKSFRRAFGLFNSYITYYLTAWFAEHESNDFSFPCSPARLKGVIFIDRPANPTYAAPRTLFELLEHISQRYRNSPNTIKVWIANLKDFFDYVEKYQEMYSDLLGGETGFYSPIDRTDIPRGTRLRKTQKKTFENRLFKTLVSYARALLDVQDQLANVFESGELEINRILEADFINIKDLPIKQPLVDHYGKKYHIEKVPNFLEEIRMKNKEGIDETFLYPGLLRHNYLMLETGIRGMQLRWLDETSYDRYVDRKSRSYMEMLYVNTNKDGCAWISVVSSRVIDQLDAQRYWKSRVTQSSFHLPCQYSDSEKNYYGEIYPVFSYQLNGRPFENEKYSKTWRKMLLGFQWFLSLHGLDSVSYVKYLPQGIGLNVENLWNSNLVAVQAEYARVAKYNIKITDNHDQAEYCPVSLRALVTPHGARATVVSEAMQALSPRFVGEYITGQKERTVLYYDTPDKETMARTLRKQHMMMASKDGHGFIECVDPNDPVLNECREVNIRISKAAAEGESIGRDAGLFSIKACLCSRETRNGLELLNAGKARRLGIHPSHLCAFNNVCPKELVDMWGQTQLCGICSYSINHVMHLPAISAMCDKAWEEYERAKEHYLEFKDRKDVSDDEKNRADQKIIWLCSDALGWELRERALIERARQIHNGENVGELIVERPEDVAAYIDAHHIRTDETDYILKRLRDCIKFPLTDSESIKAKFALASRRILMMEGKVNEALEDRGQATAASELYSLLHTFQEMHGYSHAEIFGLIRTKLLDRLNETQAKLGNSRMRGLEIVNLEVD